MTIAAWFALGVTFIVSVLLTCGLCKGLQIVRQVTSELKSPLEKTYTVLMARFPDPLILQFGYKRRLTDLPNNVHLTFVPWGDGLSQLAAAHSRIAYTNRQMAKLANDPQSRIILRPKNLCLYRGFSICVANPPASKLGALRSRDEMCDELKELLGENCKLLVTENTDQHLALKALLHDELGVAKPEVHIAAVAPDDDILERALQTRLDIASDIIGFAAGITERLAGERLGFRVVAEQPAILNNITEANCFAYLRPTKREDDQELTYILGHVEALWDASVAEIFEKPAVREDFRRFLNAELRSRLGALAQSKLDAAALQIVTPADMSNLLGHWLKFPERDD